MAPQECWEQGDSCAEARRQDGLPQGSRNRKSKGRGLCYGTAAGETGRARVESPAEVYSVQWQATEGSGIIHLIVIWWVRVLGLLAS